MWPKFSPSQLGVKIFDVGALNLLDPVLQRLYIQLLTLLLWDPIGLGNTYGNWTFHPNSYFSHGELFSTNFLLQIAFKNYTKKLDPYAIFVIKRRNLS